jgi:hypothetical protein
MLGQTSLFAPETTEPLRNRVQIVRVELCDVRQILERFHYLKRCRTGRQINYAVLIDGICDGVITYAYPMMSAPLCGVPSDELLEFARLYLHQNIPHSASCAVGKSLKRIRQDWLQEYPDAKPPRLVVSWSDTEYHKGTIYKASNFQFLRQTKGGGAGNTANSKRGARKPHADYDHIKDCWIYWLKD